MRLKSIVAFVPTRNAEKSREFYEQTLGLRFVQDDGYAIVMDSGGTMVRIAKVGEYQPFPFTMLGWEVEDIAASVTEVATRGAAVERYGFLEQDEHGIWSAPGGAKVAWFKDPDGNLLSFSQHPAAPAKRTAAPAKRTTAPAKPAAAPKKTAETSRPKATKNTKATRTK